MHHIYIKKTTCPKSDNKNILSFTLLRGETMVFCKKHLINGCLVLTLTISNNQTMFAKSQFEHTIGRISRMAKNTYKYLVPTPADAVVLTGLTSIMAGVWLLCKDRTCLSEKLRYNIASTAALMSGSALILYRDTIGDHFST